MSRVVQSRAESRTDKIQNNNKKYVRNRKSWSRKAKRGKDPPKTSSARRRKTKSSSIDPESQESDVSSEPGAELSSPPLEKSTKRARKSHSLCTTSRATKTLMSPNILSRFKSRSILEELGPWWFSRKSKARCSETHWN